MQNRLSSLLSQFVIFFVKIRFGGSIGLFHANPLSIHCAIDFRYLLHPPCTSSFSYFPRLHLLIFFRVLERCVPDRISRFFCLKNFYQMSLFLYFSHSRFHTASSAVFHLCTIYPIGSVFCISIVYILHLPICVYWILYISRHVLCLYPVHRVCILYFASLYALWRKYYYCRSTKVSQSIYVHVLYVNMCAMRKAR